MGTKNEQQGLLQIRSVDPKVIHKFKVYAVTKNMTHAQVFTEAFALLSRKEKNAKKEERDKRAEKEVSDGAAHRD